MGQDLVSTHFLIIALSIDDVTTVYLQQTQGIGLSIHSNELLTVLLYCSLHGLCIVAGVLKAHAGHDVTCHIIYRVKNSLRSRIWALLFC